MVEVSISPEKPKQGNIKAVFVEDDPLMTDVLEDVVNSVGGMSAVFLSGLSERETVRRLREMKEKGQPTDILFMHFKPGKTIRGLQIFDQATDPDDRLANKVIIISDVSQEHRGLPSGKELEAASAEIVTGNLIKAGLIKAKESLLKLYVV